MKYTLVFLVLICNFAVAQTRSSTVQIGQLAWDTKNLAVTTFANGEKIENAQTPEQWLLAGKEGRAAWCYYENNASNGPTYGILYNFFAVADPRGLAPKGWHVPTKYEWIPMLDFLGGKDKVGNKLKSKTRWTAVSGADRNGTDSTGFNALPAGLRFAADGKFDGLGTRCQFWTSTKNDSERGAIIVLGINNPIQIGIANMNFGYSVRCVKD